jgi:hypothetical protein
MLSSSGYVASSTEEAKLLLPSWAWIARPLRHGSRSRRWMSQAHLLGELSTAEIEASPCAEHLVRRHLPPCLEAIAELMHTRPRSRPRPRSRSRSRSRLGTHPSPSGRDILPPHSAFRARLISTDMQKTGTRKQAENRDRKQGQTTFFC